MPKADVSGSDTEEKESNSSSDELENPIGGGSQKMTEYEKQRMKRIEENRARMEALGLPKLGSSLMGSARNTKTKRERNTKTKREPKGKAKVTEEEDEEYRPPAGEDAMSSSSDDEEETSGSRTSKVKKKHSRTKKKIPIQKLMSKSDFVDDDEALMQAIALSLKDFAECSDLGHSKLSQSVDACLNGVLNNERRGNALIQEGTTKRKRKKMVSSRVQMTEDELVVHFFQFDVAYCHRVRLDVKQASCVTLAKPVWQACQAPEQSRTCTSTHSCWIYHTIKLKENRFTNFDEKREESSRTWLRGF